jgi:hypothetical protein
MKTMRAIAALTLFAMAGAASAGPPFLTDDPEPTDLHHWEIYNFVSGSHVAHDTAGQAGFDINYGGAKDLQLTAVVPLDYDHADRFRAGLGDMELAAKYKFIHQGAGSALPDISFFPRVYVPTAGRRFGNGRVALLLPLWAEKDAGAWSLFGGGGYTINPGEGQRDYWHGGVGLVRKITSRLQLGVELFHFGPDADDARPFTQLNVGALWRLSPHWSLIGSAGPGIQHARDGGTASFYGALKADY